MEYSWFLAGLLMVISSSNNMHLIIHLLIEYFLISYQISITEPFSLLIIGCSAYIHIPFCFYSHWPQHYQRLTFTLRFAALHELNLQTNWVKVGRQINLHPPFFSAICSRMNKKNSSDLLFLLIKHRKWARIPSLCLNALTRCLPLRELQHVNYICYQPRWWLIRYFCLLTMTSW